MFGKVNKKSSGGGGFDASVNLTSLLNTVNATWVAPADGMMSNFIRVSSATAVSGYWYLKDVTLLTYACTLYGSSGDYLTNATPIIKGHTYKVTACANISDSAFIFYPFK